jgi:predicted N-acetyltransferase YhbS
VNISIRTLTLADLQVADGLNQAAFETQESRIADMQRYLEAQPDGWFLAESHLGPLGMVGAMNYYNSAYIGQLAVLPEFQRMGVGSALMQHMLAWMQKIKVPSVLLDASKKGFPLYTRLGFSVQDTTSLYALNQPTNNQADCSRCTILLREELDELAAFDSAVFPGNRSRLLTILQRDLPNNVLLIRDEEGRISGYLFIQGAKLGPWVSTNPQDSESLLQAALSWDLSGPPFTIVPDGNRAAAVLLGRYGFKPVRTIRFMVRGAVPVYRRDFVYGQYSFAIG